uniref:Magnesium transporter n=1 Tax=Chrysotila carterae TaxID=13221 RepID=A0A7S4F3N7_CHRCT
MARRSTSPPDIVTKIFSTTKPSKYTDMPNSRDASGKDESEHAPDPFGQRMSVGFAGASESALTAGGLPKGGQFLLVLEFRRNAAGVFRNLTRKQLLEEARAASLPLRLRAMSPRRPTNEATHNDGDGVSASGVSVSVSVSGAGIGAGGGGHDESLLGTDVPLMARDVRKVDPLFAGRLEPVILVRCGSITVSLGRTELRAIILHDRLYFIVPDGADSILQVVQKNLSTILSGGGSIHEGMHSTTPHARERDHSEIGGHALEDDADEEDFEASVAFEFAALEAVLLTACSELHKQQEHATAKVREALHSLRRTVLGTRVVAGARQLESVRELKHQVRELSVQASALQKAFETVLDQDDNMERMYLTRLHYAEAAQLSLKHAEHEEAEMLFESYLQDVASSISSLEVVEHQIESTEKFVSFRLDSARNRLLKVDLLTTTVGAIFGFGSFIGSIFGMNLQSPLFSGSEFESGWTFNLVVGLTLGTMFGFFAALYAYFSPAFEHFGLAHVSRVR